MKITIIAKSEELAAYKGLFKHLITLISSVKIKGYDINLALYEDANMYYDIEGYVITIGSVQIKSNYPNITIDDNLNNFSYSFFEIIKNILIKNADICTLKLFGNLGNVGKIIENLEKKFNNSLCIFLFKEDLVITIKILFTPESEDAVREIISTFKKNIYAEDDVSLDFRLLELLQLRNKKISIAESLTGGQICSTIINNAGASNSVYEGLVTYSNESKIDRLNVDDQTIYKFGAVSYETAYEMAAGLLAKNTCDIAIATTGIAGPSGGNLSKPVGLTFIAIGIKEKIHVYRHIFSGNRNEVQTAASQAALFYAVKKLKDNSMEYEEIQIK